MEEDFQLFTDRELEEAVFNGRTLPIEKGGPDGDNPWDIVDERIEKDEHKRILITDSGDSDGLGVATLLSHKFDSEITVLPASHRSWGYGPIKTIDKVLENVDNPVPIYITDLGQTEDTMEDWKGRVEDLVEKGHEVRIRDHHDNPKELVEGLNEIDGVEYVHTKEMCATKIVHEVDYRDAPEHIADLAELTNVRDMFMTDHERFDESEILSNVAFWFPFNHYVEAAMENGVNLNEDPEWGSYIEARTEIKQAKLDRVMETREFHENEEVRVGFVHGDCYHSEAGRRLIENHGADIAIIIKSNSKISFRTADDFPIANTIADKFGGGGHKHAAATGDFFTDIDLNDRDSIVFVKGKILEAIVDIVL